MALPAGRHQHSAEKASPKPAIELDGTATQADMVALFGIEQVPPLATDVLFHIDTYIRPP